MRDDQKQMNKAAGDMGDESQEPENDKNNNNRIKHIKISPIGRSTLSCPAPWTA